MYRRHVSRHNGTTSPISTSNASVIQGSALGPATYIVNAADMTTLSSDNSLHKYADDTYLMIPAKNKDTAARELANIESWAAANNLHLNHSKSMEIIFTDPNKKRQMTSIETLPPPLPGTPRVEVIKVLGI